MAPGQVIPHLQKVAPCADRRPCEVTPVAATGPRTRRTNCPLRASRPRRSRTPSARSQRATGAHIRDQPGTGIEPARIWHKILLGGGPYPRRSGDRRLPGRPHESCRRKPGEFPRGFQRRGSPGGRLPKWRARSHWPPAANTRSPRKAPKHSARPRKKPPRGSLRRRLHPNAMHQRLRRNEPDPTGRRAAAAREAATMEVFRDTAAGARAATAVRVGRYDPVMDNPAS